MIASIVIKLLAIDRVLTWFPDWFPNLLLVISGLFTLGLVIKLDILDRTERIYRVEASEVPLKLLARRSTLAVSKEGYGFDLEDHDGFASVLGGPFPAETLMTHVRWRLGSFDFETVYSREEAMVPHPSFRRYLFRIDRRGDQTAPVFVVPANVDVPGLMEPPPGTNEPPLAVTYSIDLGDSEFARHFRCYSADAEGAAAAMHGVMRTTLVALAGWMDTTRLRLVIDGDGILGVAGPFDDSVYAPREEGPVLDPDAALTVLLDLCIPLRLIDGLVAAETLSPATAAAI